METFEQQITIAITVYDRRQFIVAAIESALNQTIPVKVIVVEDCGPDAGLKEMVEEKFGNRIEYFRNATRRGLFDNWNACLDLCQTRFLSILHDDDLLHPEFVVSMKELVDLVPTCGLYFGETDIVDQHGKKIGAACPPFPQPWRKVSLRDFAEGNLLMFPGQLIRVDAARAIGGFRATSLYCGDYEMWAKITARFGSAQVGRTICSMRSHQDYGRGTSRVERSGKIRGLIFVQQKRIRAMLKSKGIAWDFDREKLLEKSPHSAWYLLRNARFFPERLLGYNHCLLLGSHAPNLKYALFQILARWFGPRFTKVLSTILYRIF